MLKFLGRGAAKLLFYLLMNFLLRYNECRTSFSHCDIDSHLYVKTSLYMFSIIMLEAKDVLRIRPNVLFSRIRTLKNRSLVL